MGSPCVVTPWCLFGRTSTPPGPGVSLSTVTPIPPPRSPVAEPKVVVEFRKFVTIPPPTCWQIGSAHANRLEAAITNSNRALRIILSSNCPHSAEWQSSGRGSAVPRVNITGVVGFVTGVVLHLASPISTRLDDLEIDGSAARNPLGSPSFFYVL